MIENLMSMSIEEAMEKDKDFNRAVNDYMKLDQRARDISEEVVQGFVEKIMQSPDQYDSTVCLLAASKVLTFLVSFMVEKEEEFLEMVDKARNSVVDDVIPSLLKPQPCGICPDCKDGKECKNPKIREDFTDTRLIAIIANQLIEYDMFNKGIYARVTELKEENNAGSVHDTGNETVSENDITAGSGDA